MQNASTRPWYRQPWPWILAAGPLVAVVAGLYTYKLAATTSDGLVAQDYYKQGLAADKTIARSEQARALGLVARLQLRAEGVQVMLHATAAKANFTPPSELTLTLSHPTRAGLDQTIVVPRVGDAYAAQLRLPAAGHWLVLVEDNEKTWRLLGNLLLPSNEVLEIGGNAGTKPADD